MPPAGTTELLDIAATLEALKENYTRETDLFIGPWERTFKPGAKEVLEALDAGELTRPQLEKYILALNAAFCSLSKRYGVLRLTLRNLAGFLSNHLRQDAKGALREVNWEATRKARREPVLDALEKTLRFERRESGVGEEEVRLFRDRIDEVLKRDARIAEAQSRINREQRALDAELEEVGETLSDVLGVHMDFRSGRTPVRILVLALSPAETIYRLSKTIVQSVPVLPSADLDPTAEVEEEEEKKQKEKKGAKRLDVAVQRPDEASAVERVTLFAAKFALLCYVVSPRNSPGGPGHSCS